MMQAEDATAIGLVGGGRGEAGNNLASELCGLLLAGMFSTPPSRNMSSRTMGGK